MPKGFWWSTLPFPPNWEVKYDPRTKLNYYIDHANRRTSWTDPRSWYYKDEDKSKLASLGSDGTGEDILSETTDNTFVPTDSVHKKGPIQFSEAIKTNSIVAKFLADLPDPKHDRPQRRHKTSASSASVSLRKSKPRGSDLRQNSPPPPLSSSSSASAKSPDKPRRSSKSSECDRKSEDSTATGKSSVEKSAKSDELKHLKSVPESEEAHSTTDTIEAEKSTKSSQPDKTPEVPIEGKPRRVIVQSKLLLPAKGHDPSLLGPRVQAKGHNPSLAKGHNASLAKGPNSALLLRNQC